MVVSAEPQVRVIDMGKDHVDKELPQRTGRKFVLLGDTDKTNAQLADFQNPMNRGVIVAAMNEGGGFEYRAGDRAGPQGPNTCHNFIVRVAARLNLAMPEGATVKSWTKNYNRWSAGKPGYRGTLREVIPFRPKISGKGFEKVPNVRPLRCGRARLKV